MNRFNNILFYVMLIPSIIAILLGSFLNIDIKLWWIVVYWVFAALFLSYLKMIIQLKKDRPDLGIREHIRLRKELNKKNRDLLKTDGPEELEACILARRELVEQAAGADKVLYTMNLAERLFVNGELDEAAGLLDSIAHKVEGSITKLVYWNNRTAIEMVRQNEEAAANMLPLIFENLKRVTGGTKTRKQLEIIHVEASLWQAVIEKRYEEALLLLDKWERNLDDVESSQENMKNAKQYLLMQKRSVYLKMNKKNEVLQVEKELEREKWYPLTEWWLERQGAGKCN